MSRKCQACGAQLSSYNAGVLCFPCQEKRREELQQKLSDTLHYTLDDMRFLLGLQNPESVKRLGREGIIPGKIPGVRRHLYLKEQVDQWIRTGGKRADGEGRQREATKKITKVTPVSGKRDEPYQETPHKQKMRELAGKLMHEIGMPWIMVSFIVELKPQRLVYADSRGHSQYPPIIIAENEKISIDISIEGKGEMDHLHKGLRSHLETGGFSKVLDDIGNWRQGVADNLAKCHGFFTLVKKKLEKSYSVAIPLKDDGQPGFTMWFPITICADAIEQASGSAHFRDFPYTHEGLNLKFGAYGIYCGIPNEDLKPYEDAHKRLRAKYGTHKQAKEIAKQREELYQIQAKIGQQLQKFMDMERLPGHCELCS